MPSFDFNPHRHIKIWLSEDRYSFLNLQNQLRLIRLRELNPTDEIHFLYESRLLSPNALEELAAFCKKYNLLAKDICKDILPACETPEEKNLITLYETEIDNLTRGGNPAVASDIVRWLKPCYQLGTYSDCDTAIDTRKLPSSIPVKAPLLFNIGSLLLAKDVENSYLNNDFIAVVDHEEALSAIKKIQTFIYHACSKKSPALSTSEHTSAFKTNKTERQIASYVFWGTKIANIIENTPEQQQENNDLDRLHALNRNRSALEVRQAILRLTRDNATYCAEMKCSVAEVAECIRQSTKKELGFFSWLMTNRIQYNKAKQLAESKDDETLITNLREKFRETLLTKSVTCTTGPFIILDALFPKPYYNTPDFNREMRPYAFAHYGLEKAFHSKNSIPLQATMKEYQQLQSQGATSDAAGVIGDRSWLDAGRRVISTRESKMINSTRKIQRTFKRKQAVLPFQLTLMKDKMNAHKQQLLNDLANPFYYYLAYFSNEQKFLEIMVLMNLLDHFKEDCFHARAFKAELQNYQASSLYANSRNKTKIFIDKLTLLNRQASAFSLLESKEDTIRLRKRG